MTRKDILQSTVISYYFRKLTHFSVIVRNVSVQLHSILIRNLQLYNTFFFILFLNQLMILCWELIKQFIYFDTIYTPKCWKMKSLEFFSLVTEVSFKVPSFLCPPQLRQISNEKILISHPTFHPSHFLHRF